MAEVVPTKTIDQETVTTTTAIPRRRRRMGGYPGIASRAGRRGISTCLFVFLLLAGITALIVWLIYRPYTPKFRVTGVAIYDLNTTSPPMITTTMQFTIVTRNSNRRISIYYDHLSAFVMYRNQAITPPTTLPPMYQEKHSTVVLSPVLGGAMMPVSEDVVNGLEMDQAYGVVGLRLVLLGRLRWKAGAIRTAHYGIYVRCDMMVGLKTGFVGQAPLLGSPECKVDV